MPCDMDVGSREAEETCVYIMGIGLPCVECPLYKKPEEEEEDDFDPNSIPF